MMCDNSPKKSQSQQVQEDKKHMIPQLPKTSKNLISHNLASSLALGELEHKYDPSDN